MREALAEAELARAAGEVPVGAVLVREGRIMSRGHNRRENDHDPTAHAELRVLRQAASRLGSWRLDGCTLYVTLEPCPMCAGALVMSRIERLVFGAADPQYGACGSWLNLADYPGLPHHVLVCGGVEAAACRAVLEEFFRSVRE
ncbi:MAG: tRNA adenosine(34) deaminase TadA [Candidatus Xenobia bacterium]